MAGEIDLGVALDTVVSALGTQFPSFRTVVAEDEDRKEMTLPAIIVNYVDLEPSTDTEAGTGQWPCLVRFEASIVMGFRTPSVHREIIKAAAAVAQYLHNNRLGVPWGAAQIIAVEPDEFSPQADQYHVWRVEWQHLADLGTDVWQNDDIPPTEVLLTHSPDEGEYTTIAEG